MPGPVEARRYIVALLAMLQNAGKPLPSADMLGWKGSKAFPRSPCLAKADWRLAIDAQTNSGRFLLNKLSAACLETFKQINLKTPFFCKS